MLLALLLGRFYLLEAQAETNHSEPFGLPPPHS